MHRKSKAFVWLAIKFFEIRPSKFISELIFLPLNKATDSYQCQRGFLVFFGKTGHIQGRFTLSSLTFLRSQARLAVRGCLFYSQTRYLCACVRLAWLLFSSVGLTFHQSCSRWPTRLWSHKINVVGWRKVSGSLKDDVQRYLFHFLCQTSVTGLWVHMYVCVDFLFNINTDSYNKHISKPYLSIWSELPPPACLLIFI